MNKTSPAPLDREEMTFVPCLASKMSNLKDCDRNPRKIKNRYGTPLNFET